MAPVPSAPTIWTAWARKNGSGTHCAHVVRMLSSLSLELRVETEGTVWLGFDFATNASEATRKAGFGRDVLVVPVAPDPLAVGSGAGRNEAGWVPFQRDLLATLRRREMTRVPGALSEVSDVPYAEVQQDELRDSPGEIDGGKAVRKRRSYARAHSWFPDGATNIFVCWMVPRMVP